MKHRSMVVKSTLIAGAAALAVAAWMPANAVSEAAGSSASSYQGTQIAQLGENLVGKPVVTRDGVEAGEVDEIIRGENQQIEGIVVSVGGILGLGARQVLIPPEGTDVRREDGETKVHLKLSKKELDAKSEFEGNAQPTGTVK